MDDPNGRAMRQEAPYPDALEDLVRRLRYKPGWSFELKDSVRSEDDGCQGLTLWIYTRHANSYHPERMRPVSHLFGVPAASYNARSWRNWLFARIGDVDAHERAEWFELMDRPGDVADLEGTPPAVERKPYAPNHGRGNDPYVVVEQGTLEDAQRTPGT